MENKRKTYLDILRVIAILCVVYNHTNEHGYYGYAITEIPVMKVVFIMLGLFIAIGVPLFFMISGALLLGKEESLSKIWSKRISRILIVLVVFSLGQYIFKGIFQGQELSALDFLERLLKGNVVAPYWFLYSYLAYLIILPFLRMMAEKMKGQHYIYLLLLYLVVDGIIKIFMGDQFAVTIPLLENIIVYPLMGYYIEKVMEEKDFSGKNVLFSIILSLLAVAVMCYKTLERNLPIEEFTIYDKGLFTCSLTALIAVSVFFIAKYVSIKKASAPSNPKKDMIWQTLGSLTFGIYLIEQPIRESTLRIPNILEPLMGVLPSALIWVVAIVLIAGLVTFILKKIPGFKQIL